jgi:rare lipoprotein A (peptidoglycan hydrolase)
MNSRQAPAKGIQKLNPRRAPRLRTLFAACVTGCALVAGFTAASGFASTGATTSPGGTTTTAPAPTTPPPGSWTITQNATWYGPGLWGRQTACGMPLNPTVVGVAHKRLPCGTRVTFSYAGHSVPATVIDRGPFRKGYAWDLTKRTAKLLGFLPVGAGPVTATVTPPAS